MSIFMVLNDDLWVIFAQPLIHRSIFLLKKAWLKLYFYGFEWRLVSNFCTTSYSQVDFFIKKSLIKTGFLKFWCLEVLFFIFFLIFFFFIFNFCSRNFCCFWSFIRNYLFFLWRCYCQYSRIVFFCNCFNKLCFWW